MRVGPPRNEQPARRPGTDGAPIVPPRRTRVKQLLYAGIDWATKTHAVGVVDDQGGIRARFQVANTGKSFGGLIRRLTKLQVTGVAIERPDGPLVEAMLDAGLRVVVITPRQVKALRSRYGAAGAKSDAADALLLADVLRTDGHRLRPLTPDSDATQVLRALSRTRKDLQKARVALCNQLTAQLSGASPARSGCSPTCTRPPRSPSWVATRPARPPPTSPPPPWPRSCAGSTTAATPRSRCCGS